MINGIRRTSLTAAFFLLAGFPGSARPSSSGTYCQQGSSSDGRNVTVSELRDISVPARTLINVNARARGSISVIGEDRTDVLIRACISSSADSAGAARSALQAVHIETASMIVAEGLAEQDLQSVSYELHVPRSSNLKLFTFNGRIEVDSVQGNLSFVGTNGDVCLKEVSGSVEGKTVNGGVNVALTGSGWQGKGLRVETVNGGIFLSIPETYAAHIVSSTVNGSFSSNIETLELSTRASMRAGRIAADVNGGGNPIELVTTNGVVIINTSRFRTF